MDQHSTTRTALAACATLALAACGALALACGGDEEPAVEPDAADVREEMAEAADEISALAARRRQDFRRLMQQRLDRLEERMDLWSEQAAQAQREALAELEQQREALSERIEDVRGVNEERWDQFKRDVEDAFDELEQAYENLTEPAPA